VGEPQEEPVRFPTASGSGEVQGILHHPAARPTAGLVISHGRSNDMHNPLVKRIAQAAADSGRLGLRMNFRYVDERGAASRDLSREEDDLRGAVNLVESKMSAGPIFAVGKSMGARVCARASADSKITGVVMLGYPLHPQFRPAVKNPPEWPFLVKPTLFVQGDHDPFCDLTRLREEMRKLTQPSQLVVIPNAGHSFESKGVKRNTFPEVREAVFNWVAERVRP
jgi:uncharacterized protein